jgi:hypothetical protein
MTSAGAKWQRVSRCGLAYRCFRRAQRQHPAVWWAKPGSRTSPCARRLNDVRTSCTIRPQTVTSLPPQMKSRCGAFSAEAGMSGRRTTGLRGTRVPCRALRAGKRVACTREGAYMRATGVEASSHWWRRRAGEYRKRSTVEEEIRRGTPAEKGAHNMRRRRRGQVEVRKSVQQEGNEPRNTGEGNTGGEEHPRSCEPLPRVSRSAPLIL